MKHARHLIHGILFVFLAGSLTACAIHDSTTNPLKICPVPSLHRWVDVSKTADLISELVQSDSLSLIYDAQTAQTLEQLSHTIDNAHMALHVEVITAQQPVLVVCYDNTESARMLLLTLSALQTQVRNAYTLVAVDLTQMPTLRATLNYNHEPTVLYYRNGKEYGRYEVSASQDALFAWLQTVVQETISRSCS